MIETDHILLEKDGDIARVWLNRPHKKNAVTVELLHRLDKIIVEVDNDPNLKVLVLRGVNNTFCSGFDLDELLSRRRKTRLLLAHPRAIAAFGRECTPRNPLGATMVSSEGACAAYYAYRRLDLTPVGSGVS